MHGFPVAESFVFILICNSINARRMIVYIKSYSLNHTAARKSEELALSSKQQQMFDAGFCRLKAHYSAFQKIHCTIYYAMLIYEIVQAWQTLTRCTKTCTVDMKAFVCNHFVEAIHILTSLQHLDCLTRCTRVH